MLRSLFILSMFCCGLVAQHDDLFVERAYDLRSDFTFTKYLPKRLKKFERLVLRSTSLEQVQQVLQQDTDKDSYFFALRMQEPWCFVLATRGTSLLNKNAQQLQKEIFYDCSQPWCSVELVFRKFIAAARKGIGFCVPLQWRWHHDDDLGSQITYVEAVTSKFGQLVLGVGLQVVRIPHHIILKNRIEVLLRYLKKNDLDRLIELINNDINPEGYAYVIPMRYPYRWVAHGAKSEIVLKTPQEAQKITYPNCFDEACDIVKRVENELEIARRGGGYFAYLSRNDEYKRDELKLAYIQPFWYKGNRYMLGTGYGPFDMPADMYKELMKHVFDALKMIDEIGLPNTVSVLNKKNTPESYVFIEEMTPPYRPIAHGYGKVLISGYAELKQKTIYSSFRINTMRELQKDVDVAKTGGGFVVSLWKKDETDAPVLLKVSFVKPLRLQDKSYVVGMGYLFE